MIQWPCMNKNALTRYQYCQHLTLRLFSVHENIVKLRQPAYDFLPSQAKFIKIATRVFRVYFSTSILSILIFSDIACKIMFSDSRTLKMYVLWVLYSTSHSSKSAGNYKQSRMVAENSVAWAFIKVHYKRILDYYHDQIIKLYREVA